MYSIEYFKTKHDKSERKNPEYNVEVETSNLRTRKKFLHQKDIVDKCRNIKSLTIDLDDIKRVVLDDNCHHLMNLYARVRNIDTSNISAVTILNNPINKFYIYEILNCDWMINKSECCENNEDAIVEKVQELHKLIYLYENCSNYHTKVKLKKKIELYKYYINSVSTINKEATVDGKVLRLGTHFKRTK